MRKPASQFYWGDWLNCREVRAVSLAARGLWMDMLCYARQGQPIGFLTHADGRPITPEQLARMVGASLKAVRGLLVELEAAGVPGKADNGAYFSRRMVRDESAYERYRAGQAEAGKRGAAERWGKGSPSSPHDDPTENEWGEDASSSSSSSSSSSEEEEHVQPSAVCGEPKAGSPPAAPILVFQTSGRGPSTWALTADQVASWQSAYPSLDVLADCRRASAWLGAQPARRKTARGMPRFLVGWLNRTTDRHGQHGNRAARPTGRTGAPDANKYAGVMEA